MDNLSPGLEIRIVDHRVSLIIKKNHISNTGTHLKRGMARADLYIYAASAKNPAAAGKCARNVCAVWEHYTNLPQNGQSSRTQSQAKWKQQCVQRWEHNVFSAGNNPYKKKLTSKQAYVDLTIDNMLNGQESTTVKIAIANKTTCTTVSANFESAVGMSRR